MPNSPTYSKSLGQLSWAVLCGCSILMVVGSFVLQYGFGLAPCSLCILTRVCAILCMLTAILACLHRNKGPLASSLWLMLMALPTLAGIVISSRHVWMQHLPPEKVPACGPGLNYLIETLPWQEVLVALFQGSGDCARDLDAILGIPLSIWTLLAFSFLSIWILIGLKTTLKAA